MSFPVNVLRLPSGLIELLVRLGCETEIIGARRGNGFAHAGNLSEDGEIVSLCLLVHGAIIAGVRPFNLINLSETAVAGECSRSNRSSRSSRSSGSNHARSSNRSNHSRR